VSRTALSLVVAAALACSSDPVDTTPPLRLVVHAGQNQNATVGSEVPVNPTVQVIGQQGEPRSAVVKFEVTRGGGTILASDVVTGDNGLARAERWVLGSVGPNTLKASLVLDPTQFVIFNATGVSADAARGR
jgi:hypothetical protein